MKITVDGGALCSNSHFGTYTYTSNLIEAFRQYDSLNDYVVYTFCEISAKSINKSITFKKLTPSQGWMKVRVPIEERLQKADAFIAVNQAIPQTPAKIISISHGLSFLKFPQLYPDSADSLKEQLTQMIKKSAHILVSSSRVAKELKEINTSVKPVVLPFGIPFDFMTTSKKIRKNYFLFVGMDHPIKNTKELIENFLSFRKNAGGQYELYLIGNFKEVNQEGVKIIGSVDRKDLKTFYQEAIAYVTTSHYESFNFPVLEALSQSCPVVAYRSAIIPEMQEFVSIAASRDHFIKLLEERSKKKEEKIEHVLLKRRFSWEEYTKTLMHLYPK